MLHTYILTHTQLYIHTMLKYIDIKSRSIYFIYYFMIFINNPLHQIENNNKTSATVVVFQQNQAISLYYNRHLIAGNKKHIRIFIAFQRTTRIVFSSTWPSVVSRYTESKHVLECPVHVCTQLRISCPIYEATAWGRYVFVLKMGLAYMRCP